MINGMVKTENGMDTIILGNKAKYKIKDLKTNLINCSDECNKKNKIPNFDDIFTHLSNSSNEYNNRVKNYHDEAFDKINKWTEKYRNETQQIIEQDLRKQNFKEKTFYYFLREKLSFILYYQFYGGKTPNNIKYFCNCCGKTFNGIVYACMTCQCFLLCKSCILNNGLHSSEHIFKPMLEAPTKPPIMNSDENMDAIFTYLSKGSFEIIYQKAKEPISIDVKVRNNGNKAWDENTNINFTHKNGIPVSIGIVEKGKEISKSVTIFSLEELTKLEIGKYEKTIQLTNSKGYFGKSFTIYVEVRQKRIKKK